jgi:type II secretory pathway component PulC
MQNLRKLILLANAIIFGLVIWMGANIVLDWRAERVTIQGMPHPGRENTEKPRSITKGPRSLENYQQIIEQDIFKTSVGQGQNAEQSEKDLEITELNIKLKGTTFGEAQESYAIVEDGKTKKQTLYYLNDFVKGAKIIDILSDRLVLLRDGKQEMLMLSFELGRLRKKLRRPRRRPIRRNKTRIRRTR